MPVLAYIAIIIVGFSSILLELNWLTAAPPQPKPAVHAAAVASVANTATNPTPVAKAAAAPTAVTAAQAEPAAPKPAPDGPNKVLSPVYPTTAGAPKFDAAEKAPAAAQQTAAAPEAEAKPEAEAQASTTANMPKPAADSLQFTAKVTTVMDTLPVRPAAETTGTATAEDIKSPPAADAAIKPEGKTQTLASASTDKSAAEKTPASSSAHAAIAPSKVAATAAGACNISACSHAYSSFRESDCTYQPFSGERRVCTMSPDSSRRAETKRRPRVEHERVEADLGDLRGVEAAVRQLESRPRGRSYRAESRSLPADMGAQDVDDDGSVVIYRRGGRW